MLSADANISVKAFDKLEFAKAYIKILDERYNPSLIRREDKGTDPSYFSHSLHHLVFLLSSL